MTNDTLDALEPLIGEWSMEARFPGAPSGDIGARTVFEWLPGRRFLIQRWQVPHPDAPDGIAIIGFDQAKNNYVQHYFDSRGVARVYEMTFGDGVWELSRTTADMSPLDFAQRYTGTFSDDQTTIRGSWEISNDGSTWEHDFELIYIRVQ